MKGLYLGKPGLPHFNTRPRCSKNSRYVFEVRDEVVNAAKAHSRVRHDPTRKASATRAIRFSRSLAYQRLEWDDNGVPNRFDLNRPARGPQRSEMSLRTRSRQWIGAFAPRPRTRAVHPYHPANAIRLVLRREMRFEPTSAVCTSPLGRGRKNNYALRTVIRPCSTSARIPERRDRPRAAGPSNKNRLAKLAPSREGCVKSAAAGRVAGAGQVSRPMSSLADLRLAHTAQEYLVPRTCGRSSKRVHQRPIYAMAGARSRATALIIGNLMRHLGNHSWSVPAKCTPAMRVKVSETGTYVYPDVVVVCGEPGLRGRSLDTLMNPTLVVEVMSPSPRDTTVRAKFAPTNRRLSSLRQYGFDRGKLSRAGMLHRQEGAEIFWLFSEPRIVCGGSPGILAATSAGRSVPAQ